MNVLQLFKMVLARWKTGLLVLILAGLAGAYWASRQAVLFTATASLVVDNRADPVVGFNALTTPGFLATQVEIIQSPRVGRRVISNLKLVQNEGLRKQYMDETRGNGTFDGWLTQLFQKALVASPSRNSNLITVSFTSVDRQFAALIANEFTKAYMDTVLELKTTPAKQYSQFFDDRSKVLRDNLEKAQGALSSFQRERGVVVNDERLDYENTKLNDLSAQLTGLQSAAIEAASRNAQAQRNSDRTQEVLSSGLISNFKSELSKQEVKLSELKLRFGEKHPQVLEVESNIRELNDKVAAETKRVTGSVVVNESVIRQRESEVRAALAAQKSKLLKMKDTRDDLAVLQRDVDNAKQAYDSVRQRLNQTSLESESQLVNVWLLNPAAVPSEAPDKAIRNNYSKAAAGAIALALIAAFLKELLDRRVRVAQDLLTTNFDVPILGFLPGPDSSGFMGKTKLSLQQKRLLGRLPAPSARNR